MAETVQFNGEVVNIESNINKVDSFDKSLSEDAARQKYPSIQCLKEFLSVIYPIGSIYISAASTSPSSLFGGTWERIKDRFLLAAGDTYTLGATGGEAAHTLTVDEMPSHSHYQKRHWGSSGDNNLAYTFGAEFTEVHEYGSKIESTHLTGGNKPHNNMPPYLAVYVWKRTA